MLTCNPLIIVSLIGKTCVFTGGVEDLHQFRRHRGTLNNFPLVLRHVMERQLHAPLGLDVISKTFRLAESNLYGRHRRRWMLEYGLFNRSILRNGPEVLSCTDMVILENV